MTEVMCDDRECTGHVIVEHTKIYTSKPLARRIVGSLCLIVPSLILGGLIGIAHQSTSVRASGYGYDVYSAMIDCYQAAYDGEDYAAWFANHYLSVGDKPLSPKAKTAFYNGIIDRQNTYVPEKDACYREYAKIEGSAK